MWPVAVWALCAAGDALLNRRLLARDPLIFPLAMLLTGWGLNLIARLGAVVLPLRQTSRGWWWALAALLALTARRAIPGTPLCYTRNDRPGWRCSSDH
ncbi:MAG: hypothetical protein M5R42_11640 [Rhodocyclaceae bacterium]|nr:hypothetical protein [Rhodocyclaceae bacterium]